MGSGRQNAAEGLLVPWQPDTAQRRNGPAAEGARERGSAAFMRPSVCSPCGRRTAPGAEGRGATYPPERQVAPSPVLLIAARFVCAAIRPSAMNTVRFHGKCANGSHNPTNPCGRNLGGSNDRVHRVAAAKVRGYRSSPLRRGRESQGKNGGARTGRGRAGARIDSRAGTSRA